jgi:hypothetical protein
MGSLMHAREVRKNERCRNALSHREAAVRDVVRARGLRMQWCMWCPVLPHGAPVTWTDALLYTVSPVDTPQWPSRTAVAPGPSSRACVAHMTTASG